MSYPLTKKDLLAAYAIAGFIVMLSVSIAFYAEASPL